GGPASTRPGSSLRSSRVRAGEPDVARHVQRGAIGRGRLSAATCSDERPRGIRSHAGTPWSGPPGRLLSVLERTGTGRLRRLYPSLDAARGIPHRGWHARHAAPRPAEAELRHRRPRCNIRSSLPAQDASRPWFQRPLTWLSTTAGPGGTRLARVIKYGELSAPAASGKYVPMACPIITAPRRAC